MPKCSEALEKDLMKRYNTRGGRNAGDDDTGPTEVIALLESQDEEDK